ncbi:hypothetical protein HYR69_06290 [Candidatus Sumerlaeota bacterium]|nr:hypothetical protein [Candidatus Sumerlaeota bacterium]
MLLIHFVRGAFRRWISGCAIILCATSLWAQWSQQQILSLPPGDGAADDRFGNRVAVDGNVAVVGIYRDDIGANADQGSAIIYRYNGSLWVEEARLTASDGLAGDEFGFWVSIKGSVAVIGALWDDIGANVDQGSAYVFRYNGTTWVQEQKLTAADGAAGDIFGNCLSVSGNAIAVGAPYSDPSFTDQGAVYVFRYNGTSWVQEQKLVASDGASGDAFGNSVSIDNGVIVAGANGDNNGAVLDQGSSYVFRFNGSSWVQEQKLTASDGAANDWFGWSVSINANAVIIGSIYDDIGGNTDQGSAYVFRYNGSSWSQEQKVTASDGLAADHFGRSVGLDGPLAIIGADQDDIGLNVDQGSGYVFRYNGSSWLQEQKVTSSDGAANDLFGHPVAISGNVILAGALFHDITSNPDQGSAYVFRYNGSTWIQEQELSLPGDLGSANDNFAIRSQVNGNVAIVGAYHDDIGLNSDQGSAYIYRLTGGTWIREAKLIASDGQAGDQFGYWVSIEGNVAVVGAVWDDIGANTNQGSAYVFRYNGTS